MNRLRLSPLKWAVILVSLILSLIVGGGHFLSSQMPQEDSFAGLDLFSQVFSLIELRYVDSVDSDTLIKSAYRSMVESTDSYSSYLSPEELRVFNAQAPLGELGLSLIRHNGMAVISAVRPDSPAGRAELKEGAVVHAVDDRVARKFSLTALKQALRGEPGSSVTLSIIVWNDVEESNYTLVRELLSETDCTLRPEGPAYILRFDDFSPRTAAQAAELLQRSELQGRPLLIDLRHNASSDFESAMAVADLFVDDGMLGRKKTKAGEDPTHARPDTTRWSGPVALLADATTSGAGELFAEALRQAKRAELWGQPTGSRGLAQTLVLLQNGGALWLSNAEYLTPDGQPLEGHGLEPDQKIKDDDDTQSDEVLEAALRALLPDMAPRPQS